MYANVRSVINANNKKILRQAIEKQNERTCNCIIRENCPLQNNCLTKNVIYEATIHSNNQQGKKYIGLYEPTFKKRYAGHKSSFDNQKYMHNTALSTEYWRMKEANENPRISWRIIETSKAFTPELKKCHLCLSEKFHIDTYKDQQVLLNRKSEIVSKCRHRRKFELSLHDSADWRQWSHCMEDIIVQFFILNICIVLVSISTEDCPNGAWNILFCYKNVVFFSQIIYSKE